MLSRPKIFLGVLLAASSLILAALLLLGYALYPSEGESNLGLPAAESHVTGLLLAILTIIGAAKICGRLMQRLGQPAVMGELIAGICLGPSLLGRLAPDISARLFSPPILEALQPLSQLGIILFMFLVGIEFDSRSLRQKSLAVLSISLSSMIIPFLLGIALALFLFETYAPSGIDFLRFSLFIGAAMSITAFPVLVRILQDLKLENRPFAKLAISCAALDDALAWCLLAVVVGISQGDSWLVLRQFTGLMFFLTIQWFLIRPWIGRMEVLAEKQGLSGETLPLLFCLLFVSSMITEKLGVHALFGAFVVGSLVSKESRLAHEIQEKTGTLLLVLFIPLFFAQAGLKTQISLLFTTEGLCLSALVIGLATIGKIGGTYIAAFTHTKDSHEAWSLSVLMNTRGLMEIIVLTLGLQMGIIDERLFTIFVTMALVTTLMTAPLLSSKRSGSIVKRP